MPPGLTVEGLLGYLVEALGEDGARAWWRWFSVEYPDWARDGWTRLDDVRSSFRATRPPGPP